jgi:hypothetical protein
MIIDVRGTATGATSEFAAVMSDWCFILKGIDGMSEPEVHRVRAFLKTLGRRFGLRVGFAPIEHRERSEVPTPPVPSGGPTQQRHSNRKGGASLPNGEKAKGFLAGAGPDRGEDAGILPLPAPGHLAELIEPQKIKGA